VELPHTVDSLALYQRALDAGVGLAPGQLFGPHGGYEHFIRLSYGHPWDDHLQQGVETVGRIAARMAHSMSR
jgi:DNA-binding transcriptional MocR family regulator